MFSQMYALCMYVHFFDLLLFRRLSVTVLSPEPKAFRELMIVVRALCHLTVCQIDVRAVNVFLNSSYDLDSGLHHTTTPADGNLTKGSCTFCCKRDAHNTIRRGVPGTRGALRKEQERLNVEMPLVGLAAS